MSGNSFLVNPKDGTINVHYDGLTPADVLELIERLQGNLQIMALKPTNPIEVIQQSAKLDRTTNILSFQLAWNAPILMIDLSEDDATIPDPNVSMTDEQSGQYYAIIEQMVQSVRDE